MAVYLQYILRHTESLLHFGLGAPMGSENLDDKFFCSKNPEILVYTPVVSLLGPYRLSNENNLYGFCGADCLWLPNSIFRQQAVVENPEGPVIITHDAAFYTVCVLEMNHGISDAEDSRVVFGVGDAGLLRQDSPPYHLFAARCCHTAENKVFTPGIMVIHPGVTSRGDNIRGQHLQYGRGRWCSRTIWSWCWLVGGLLLREVLPPTMGQTYTLLSPPVQLAWWGYIYHFLWSKSICILTTILISNPASLSGFPGLPFMVVSCLWIRPMPQIHNSNIIYPTVFFFVKLCGDNPLWLVG